MPSGPNYKRNYKQEAKIESPLRKKKRAMRNKARRVAQKAGLVKKGDGKDVHHKDHNPSNNSHSNLAIVRKSVNRSKNRA